MAAMWDKCLHFSFVLSLNHFLILFLLGEAGFGNIFPLFLVDQGVPAASVGVWTGLAPLLTSMAGSSLGAMFYSESVPFSMTDSFCSPLILNIIIHKCKSELPTVMHRSGHLLVLDCYHAVGF